jgi:cytochrome c oxidase cbb3-type subunit 4
MAPDLGIDHGTLVWLSKSLGLFYLIGLSLAVVVYAYWRPNKKRFDEAAASIIDDENKPWQ